MATTTSTAYSEGTVAADLTDGEVRRDVIIEHRDELNQEPVAKSETSEILETRIDTQNVAEETMLSDRNMGQNLGHQMITRSKVEYSSPKFVLA